MKKSIIIAGILAFGMSAFAANVSETAYGKVVSIKRTFKIDLAACKASYKAYDQGVSACVIEFGQPDSLQIPIKSDDFLSESADQKTVYNIKAFDTGYYVAAFGEKLNWADVEAAFNQLADSIPGKEVGTVLLAIVP